MKNAAVILFLFFLGVNLWAQQESEDIFRYPLQQNTMNAFISTCANLAAHPYVQGNFEQEKILSRLNRSLKSSGSFLIASDTGMVWETIHPFPSTMVLVKDAIIQSRPGGQKTVLSAQGNETFIRLAEIISTVFTGNAQGLLENFEVYYKDAVFGTWELGLSPIDKAIGSFAQKIIMKGDTAIRSIQIYEQSGDTIKYILSNHNYPAELESHEKSLFAFP